MWFLLASCFFLNYYLSVDIRCIVYNAIIIVMRSWKSVLLIIARYKFSRLYSIILYCNIIQKNYIRVYWYSLYSLSAHLYLTFWKSQGGENCEYTSFQPSPEITASCCYFKSLTRSHEVVTYNLLKFSISHVIFEFRNLATMRSFWKLQVYSYNAAVCSKRKS